MRINALLFLPLVGHVTIKEEPGTSSSSSSGLAQSVTLRELELERSLQKTKSRLKLSEEKFQRMQVRHLQNSLERIRG